MNVKINGAAAYVTLSRRNLLTLLAKLDGNPSLSERTIHRVNEDGDVLQVTAEEDDIHYGKRRPGPMDPDTEEAIRRFVSGDDE